MRSLLALALLTSATFAADEVLTVDARELPRFPAVEPANAPATFQIKPGFHADLVAGEPLVASPIAISFDENGRMFVVEMRDYSEQRDEKPHLGRVRLVEDRDGDGKYDHASVFADDLPWPTAVIWANGGVFVAAAPDIWWLKDNDGDGRADVREVVFTGFTTGNTRLNVQALPNSFAWGPDNRVHMQGGTGNRGVITCPKRPDLKPEETGARDFWFDPRTFDFGFETGGGQYGMSYDNRGRRFVCNNSDHLRMFVFDSRYAARNKFCNLPAPLASVAADGPAAEVFRISPDEPWRVIRTRWRVSGRVPGVVEGGGRVSGYFTGATGTTVYRGDAYGPDFVCNTFTGDAGGNLVHRKVIRADGVSVIGERPADERKAEFFASRDTWFRPVDFANAPDGTLYVIDMYREVIEHPWSIPEPIKQHLDLTSGRDRGRIWRLAPDGFKPRPAPKLGSASTAELVATLAHPNGWHRDTAARLLWERSDAAARPLLAKMLADGKSPLGRLHALRALASLDGLSEAVVLRALADEDDAVREFAVVLCEKQGREGRAPGALWKKLASLTEDPAPRVRMQLAFTLGEFSNDGVIDVLAALARRDVADSWIAPAVRSGPPERMAPLVAALARDAAFVASNAGAAFLVPLATGVGARHDEKEVAALFALATTRPPKTALLAALGDGLARAGRGLAQFDRDSRLPALFADARRTLADSKAPAGSRTDAARILAFDASNAGRDALVAGIDPQDSDALLRAIFQALDLKSAAALIERWSQFDGRVRAEAARFFGAKPAHAAVLLAALEKGAVKAGEIPEQQATQLRASRDAKVAALAAKLLPAPVIENRETVIKRYMPALALTGAPEKGRLAYQQRCATCHRLRGEGTAFGPDLESVITGGREKLLTHMLDPNREVAPQFAAYTAELKDGSALAGVLASETPDSVTIREPLGRETNIPRAQLARLQTTGKSPMPEGLEAGLTAQDVADLLAFLTGPAPSR